MTQESFPFDEERGAARWSDPATSQDAAESLNPKHLYSIIRAILARARTDPEIADRCGIPLAQARIGLNSHEIAHVSGIAYGSITPRMKPMRKKDWIYDTEVTRAWSGAPGHPASTRQSTVWQLTAYRNGKP